MIAPLSVEVGRPVRFEGYAEDYGVPIVTVQFSLDDGENWTDYDVSASTGDRWVHWTFEYTPEVPGTYCLLVAGWARSRIPLPLSPSRRKARGGCLKLHDWLQGRASEQVFSLEGPGSSGPLSMTTHEVIVVDLLQAATSLGARPCRGPLCWYTVRRINGLCVFPGKS